MRDGRRTEKSKTRSVLQHQSGSGDDAILIGDIDNSDSIIFPAAGQPIIAGMLMSGREGR